MRLSARHVPCEIIQEILSYLNPADFDSARRTCTSWMLASLDGLLLKEMLCRGGWSSGVEEEIDRLRLAMIQEHGDDDRSGDPIAHGLLISIMSDRLAQETTYLPALQPISREIKECRLPASTRSGREPLIRDRPVHLVGTYDITALVSGDGPAGIGFIMAVCGRFLMASEGCSVYIFELTREGFTPFTSVTCPRRVVAMAMDTSSNRFAIAALCDGRMGIVCDFDSDGLKIESPSTYHSLCSYDDPPRSVAICPSRRCVAFGCAAGIELHWVDALSGRNLMKWFPLTAQSDFLYFLPARTGIDNPNKLRLVSSRAGPGQRGGTERVAFCSSTRPLQAQQSGIAGWSSTLRLARSVREVRDDLDHFAAVPLSDGIHLLFTDPGSGMLFLGSDAPFGGPSKLLRKIKFVPPPGVVPLSAGQTCPPAVFAAALNLLHGVKVAAFYGDHLVLFSVPSDVFNHVKKQDGTSLMTSFDDILETESSKHWMNWWAPLIEAEAQAARWPLSVVGILLANIPGAVDVAVQTEGILRVWAVTVNGEAMH